MILAVDIGNTSCSCAIFDNSRLVKRWDFATEVKSNSEYWKNLICRGLPEKHRISSAIIASVVSEVTDLVKDILLRIVAGKVVVLDTQTPLPIVNAYSSPHHVGVDRLANATGAYYLVGVPSIVVDVGTAITLDCVDREQRFLGGAILPGPVLQVRALNSFTSALPLIELTSGPVLPSSSTVGGINAGVLFGISGAVERLIREAKAVLGSESAVLLTGGQSHLIPSLPEQDYRLEPDLTLYGLMHICSFQLGL